MPYLFAAFCAVWIILFLYLLSLSRRQRVLAHEIEELKQIIDRKSTARPT
ncbi:MAG: CcmD family protein [Deltaproteobacteria bacterium]|nr:CcmD family protein [Deltaproteobacteria bacterium]